ncbi:MAG: GNAT family N-acetyltransferase [Acidobacteria bacterium]|nr:GNAT family N-acetyltransferase [Acidobacteriota bacterium]
MTRPFSQEEWTGLVSEFEDVSLMQSWEYAEAKRRTGFWQVERGIFCAGDRIVGAVQALLFQIPMLGGLVWINRGPLWRRSEEGDGSLLPAMMEALRSHWVERRHMYLRVALPLLDGERNPCRLETLGYQEAGHPGWASARLCLSPPLSELRSRLDKKWRNCLSKAERLGIVTRSSGDEAAFGAFLAGYRRMLDNRRLRTSVTPGLLSTLQRLLPAERSLLVWIGKENDRVLGTVVLARYGHTCEYLAGVTEDACRAANIGHLLLWRAVCEMKSLGYAWFDLGGMDPQRTPPGIFHFKAGIGASEYRLRGEVEAYEDRWLSRLVRSRVRGARKPLMACIET